MGLKYLRSWITKHLWCNSKHISITILVSPYTMSDATEKQNFQLGVKVLLTPHRCIPVTSVDRLFKGISYSTIHREFIIKCSHVIDKQSHCMNI